LLDRINTLLLWFHSHSDFLSRRTRRTVCATQWYEFIHVNGQTTVKQNYWKSVI